jgi:hypothetical protein
LFDVAVQSRCSDELMQWSPTNGLREVVVHVDEDVVVLGKRAGPKNLIARLSRAGSLGRRGSEATAY